MHAHEAEALVRPLLWIGFDGRTPTPEAARLIQQGVSGVILFARNVGTSDETRALIRELGAERYALLWKVPARGEMRLSLSVALPERCTASLVAQRCAAGSPSSWTTRRSNA